MRLFEQLHRSRAAVKLLLRGRVQIRGKRGERLELAILGEVKPQAAGHRLHGLDLRRSADA